MVQGDFSSNPPLGAQRMQVNIKTLEYNMSRAIFFEKSIAEKQQSLINCT